MSTQTDVGERIDQEDIDGELTLEVDGQAIAIEELPTGVVVDNGTRTVSADLLPEGVWSADELTPDDTEATTRTTVEVSVLFQVELVGGSVEESEVSDSVTLTVTRDGGGLEVLQVDGELSVD